MRKLKIALKVFLAVFWYIWQRIPCTTSLTIIMLMMSLFHDPKDIQALVLIIPEGLILDVFVWVFVVVLQSPRSARRRRRKLKDIIRNIVEKTA